MPIWDVRYRAVNSGTCQLRLWVGTCLSYRKPESRQWVWGVAYLAKGAGNVRVKKIATDFSAAISWLTFVKTSYSLTPTKLVTVLHGVAATAFFHQVRIFANFLRIYNIKKI